MQASYYICRFSDSWSIYDGIKQTSRQLDIKEVEILKALFPAVIFDEGRILSAIQVTSINPNKLLQLTDADNSEKIKKKESIKTWNWTCPTFSDLSQEETQTYAYHWQFGILVYDQQLPTPPDGSVPPCIVRPEQDIVL